MFKVTIELIVDGPEEDVCHVTEAVLDTGQLQDAINFHDHDDCAPLHVESAIVATVAPYAPRVE